MDEIMLFYESFTQRRGKDGNDELDEIQILQFL